MATIRKHYGKWQAIIRKKTVNQSRVFTSKSLASAWAKDIETQITNGTYQDLSELVKMTIMTKQRARRSTHLGLRMR